MRAMNTAQWFGLQQEAPQDQSEVPCRACIETNLNTRMIVIVPVSTTAAEFRERITQCHSQNFPEHGNVRVTRLMVWVFGFWYTFSEGSIGVVSRGTDARFKAELVVRDDDYTRQMISPRLQIVEDRTRAFCASCSQSRLRKSGSGNEENCTGSVPNQRRKKKVRSSDDPGNLSWLLKNARGLSSLKHLVLSEPKVSETDKEARKDGNEEEPFLTGLTENRSVSSDKGRQLEEEEAAATDGREGGFIQQMVTSLVDPKALKRKAGTPELAKSPAKVPRVEKNLSGENLELETGQAETAQADRCQELETGKIDRSRELETGQTDQSRELQTGQDDHVQEDLGLETGQADDVREVETGRADHIREDLELETGQADRSLEIGQADHIGEDVELKTGQDDHVETGQDDREDLELETGQHDHIWKDLELETDLSREILEPETRQKEKQADETADGVALRDEVDQSKKVDEQENDGDAKGDETVDENDGEGKNDEVKDDRKDEGDKNDKSQRSTNSSRPPVDLHTSKNVGELITQLFSDSSISQSPARRPQPKEQNFSEDSFEATPIDEAAAEKSESACSSGGSHRRKEKQAVSSESDSDSLEEAAKSHNVGHGKQQVIPDAVASNKDQETEPLDEVFREKVKAPAVSDTTQSRQKESKASQQTEENEVEVSSKTSDKEDQVVEDIESKEVDAVKTPATQELSASSSSECSSSDSESSSSLRKVPKSSGRSTVVDTRFQHFVDKNDGLERLIHFKLSQRIEEPENNSTDVVYETQDIDQQSLEPNQNEKQKTGKQKVDESSRKAEDSKAQKDMSKKAQADRTKADRKAEADRQKAERKAEAEKAETDRRKGESEKAEADRRKAEKEMSKKAEADKQKAEKMSKKAEAEKQKAEADRQKAEKERIEKAEADRQKAEKERIEKAEADRQKAEKERIEKAEVDRQKAEKERIEKAEADKKKADDEMNRKIEAKQEKPNSKRNRGEKKAKAKKFVDVPGVSEQEKLNRLAAASNATYVPPLQMKESGATTTVTTSGTKRKSDARTNSEKSKKEKSIPDEPAACPACGKIYRCKTSAFYTHRKTCDGTGLTRGYRQAHQSGWTGTHG